MKSEINVCPIDAKEHSRIEDEERGEVLCSKCGIILEEKTVSNDLSNSFEEVGGLYVLQRSVNKLGTSTILGIKDGQKNIVNKITLSKLSKQDSRTRNTFEKKNIINTDTINKIAKKIAIPKYICEDAFKMITEFSKRGKLQGRNRNVYACAALIYFCRKYSLSKSIKQVSDACSLASGKYVNENDVANAKKVLELEFGYLTKVQSIESYVPRIVSNLGLEKHERQITELAKASNIPGRNPVLIICAVIYNYCIANDMFISQNKIANKCEISSVGLRLVIRAINSSVV